MPGLILRGHICIPEEDLPAIVGELPNHIELTRREAGCLVFEVTRDTRIQNLYHVYEEFVDRTAFEAHQERVKNSRWGQLTAEAERHYEVSE